MKSIPVVALVVLVLGSVVLAMMPGYLVSPIHSQSQADLELSHTLARFATPLAWTNLVVGLILVGLLWRRPDRRTFGKVALVLALVILGAGAWMTRPYMAERMFTPLAEVVRVQAGEVTYVQPDDLVLGVRSGGEAAAYPVPIVAYHHIANDRLAGEPFVVTY